jgi:hypothetical protein
MINVIEMSETQQKKWNLPELLATLTKLFNKYKHIGYGFSDHFTRDPITVVDKIEKLDEVAKMMDRILDNRSRSSKFVIWIRKSPEDEWDYAYWM